MNLMTRTYSTSRRSLLIAAACLLISLFLGSGFAQEAPKPADKNLRVLFVGNSYCYYNDMPAMLRDLAKSRPKGVQIEVESITPGGVGMKQHFESTGALEKIRAGGFTHVVLQGQSLEPISRPEEFQSFARKLATEAKTARAEVVFYQTWARRAGAKEYGESWSGGTPKKMQAGLSESYAKAAKGLGRVARVGDAWSAARAEKDAPELFDADGSHPSPAGSYLAACVLYETLSGKSCLELEQRPDSIAAEIAPRLRKSAHAVADP